jgi:hypothetical protein
VHQGLSGFSEGLGNVVFAPADALDSGTDYIAGKPASAFGAAPPPPLPRAHDSYNGAFVEPAGPPQTKMERQIRGRPAHSEPIRPLFYSLADLALRALVPV